MGRGRPGRRSQKTASDFYSVWLAVKTSRWVAKLEAIAMRCGDAVPAIVSAWVVSGSHQSRRRASMQGASSDLWFSLALASKG